jgi:hypothetical protein
MSCTIVTAFYEIKSKFSKEKYLEWGSNFLKLSAPIVLFTDSSISSEIKKIRGDKLIHIIEIPFYELDTWKSYKEEWKKQHDKNPEKNIHSEELYTLWSNKAKFVEKAISINPFNTDYFFWCDFGAFRNNFILPIILNSFPSTKYLPRDKILLQSMGNLKHNEKIRKDDGIIGEKVDENWNEVRIVGGLWGGGKEGCISWIHSYYTMLERYFRAGRFAGNDQNVMLSTYLENPNLAIVVNPTLYYIDQWFFLQYLLSDMNIEYKLNNTYIMN